ncbi:MAG: HAD-IA family hydrolase [Armatimonadetes bacterium]|nr:HAD-IA family hydrolase [Armatimonadota bacterium]
MDAHGTLIYLDRVFERVQARLRELGPDLPLADVTHATRREFAHYTANSHLARDDTSLERLRAECGAVLLEGFHERGRVLTLTPRQAIGALLDSLDFRLYPDALPALDALRNAGLRPGVISNWDCTLPGILRRLGLEERLGVVAVSSLAGHAKPDPALFREALRRAGAPPEAALHVGDSYEHDVLGARAAGVQAALLDRSGGPAPAADLTVISSLAELVRLAGARRGHR